MNYVFLVLATMLFGWKRRTCRREERSWRGVPELFLKRNGLPAPMRSRGEVYSVPPDFPFDAVLLRGATAGHLSAVEIRTWETLRSIETITYTPVVCAAGVVLELHCLLNLPRTLTAREVVEIRVHDAEVGMRTFTFLPFPCKRSRVSSHSIHR